MQKYKNYIIKEHSLPYNKHNYGRIKEIKSIIENLGTTLIVKKCKDYNYLVNFIKEIGIKNKNLCYKYNILEDYIKTNYKGINLDYNTIDKEILNDKKNKYKIKNKITNIEELDLKKIINISTICNSVSSHLKIIFLEIEIYIIN